MHCGYQYRCGVDRGHQCLFPASVFDSSLDPDFYRQSEGPDFYRQSEGPDFYRQSEGSDFYSQHFKFLFSKHTIHLGLLFQTAMPAILVWWRCRLHLVTAHSLLISCQPFGRCCGSYSKIDTGLSIQAVQLKIQSADTTKWSARSEECHQFYYPAAVFSLQVFLFIPTQRYIFAWAR